MRRKQLKGYQFYRQRTIGSYIVDFYCLRAKLVVEVDGGQHYTEEGEVSDEIRDNHMREFGLTVVRFSDREVLKNLDGVIERLWQYL
jgi:very-short-patch-repair endonuclease